MSQSAVQSQIEALRGLASMAIDQGSAHNATTTLLAIAVNSLARALLNPTAETYQELVDLGAIFRPMADKFDLQPGARTYVESFLQAVERDWPETAILPPPISRAP